MVVIYTPNITPRIQYACKIIFHVVLRVSYRIIDDLSEFNQTKGLRIVYNGPKLKDVVWISAESLLLEEDIYDFRSSIRIGKWEDTPVIFKNDDGNIPFDIFSAVFYLVSRYEEYLPIKRDKYNRFKTSESILYKIKACDIPLVDLWCIKLAEQLNIESPLLKNTGKQSRFLLTIDIDHAWKYKNYAILPTLRKWLGCIVRLDFKSLKEVLSIQRGVKKDPADVYEYITSLAGSLKEKVLYFMLLGNGYGHDKSPSIKTKEYQDLIRMLENGKNIGIHPSYRSNGSMRILKKEYTKLCEVIGKKIEFSRQHYLKLDFPNTYDNLVSLGVRSDFSMGFSDTVGFRAGIARPFPFFNLVQNKAQSLIVVPFMVMDVTLQSYMELTPDKAIDKIKEI
ncbi:MAG: hypothetical protein MI922_29000, partial [Bacteroidales bacterium]|nr:hypothetical protein [Bacteroidales bacterium]